MSNLLEVRYKVIALWPNCVYEIGRILKGDMAAMYDQYPYLFKRLQWWEDRKPEEMPEYVKYKHDGKWIVCKVERYEHKNNSNLVAYTKTWELGYIYINNQDEPATKEEYDTYINSINTNGK